MDAWRCLVLETVYSGPVLFMSLPIKKKEYKKVPLFLPFSSFLSSFLITYTSSSLLTIDPFSLLLQQETRQAKFLQDNCSPLTSWYPPPPTPLHILLSFSLPLLLFSVSLTLLLFSQYYYPTPNQPTYPTQPFLLLFLFFISFRWVKTFWFIRSKFHTPRASCSLEEKIKRHSTRR